MYLNYRERYEDVIYQAWKKKKTGLNVNWTHDLCDTSAVLYQLTYQANLELVT